jgi:hypothetical protein
MGMKLGPSHLGKNSLRVFQNRMLRRMVGPKRYEVTDWRSFEEENGSVRLRTSYLRIVV